jgi:hypothetical protein
VDKKQEQPTARIPYRAIATNALGAGLGTFAGYYGSGALLRALSKSPRVIEYFKQLPPDKQVRFFNRLQAAVSALGGAAGVGAAGISLARLNQEAERLRKEEEAARGTKVASVYRAYRLGIERS